MSRYLQRVLARMTERPLGALKAARPHRWSRAVATRSDAAATTATTDHREAESSMGARSSSAHSTAATAGRSATTLLGAAVAVNEVVGASPAAPSRTAEVPRRGADRIAAPAASLQSAPVVRRAAATDHREAESSMGARSSSAHSTAATVGRSATTPPGAAVSSGQVPAALAPASHGPGPGAPPGTSVRTAPSALEGEEASGAVLVQAPSVASKLSSPAAEVSRALQRIAARMTAPPLGAPQPVAHHGASAAATPPAMAPITAANEAAGASPAAPSRTAEVPRRGAERIAAPADSLQSPPAVRRAAATDHREAESSMGARSSSAHSTAVTAGRSTTTPQGAAVSTSGPVSAALAPASHGPGPGGPLGTTPSAIEGEAASGAVLDQAPSVVSKRSPPAAAMSRSIAPAASLQSPPVVRRTATTDPLEPESSMSPYAVPLLGGDELVLPVILPPEATDLADDESAMVAMPPPVARRDPSALVPAVPSRGADPVDRSATPLLALPIEHRGVRIDRGFAEMPEEGSPIAAHAPPMLAAAIPSVPIDVAWPAPAPVRWWGGEAASEPGAPEHAAPTPVAMPLPVQREPAPVSERPGPPGDPPSAARVSPAAIEHVAPPRTPAPPRPEIVIGRISVVVESARPPAPAPRAIRRVTAPAASPDDGGPPRSGHFGLGQL